MSLVVKDVEGVTVETASRDSKLVLKSFVGQIESLCSRAVNSSKIHGKITVDENPQIIVSIELEDLVSGESKLHVKFHSEMEVVTLFVKVSESHVIDGEDRVRVDTKDGRIANIIGAKTVRQCDVRSQSDTVGRIVVPICKG